MCFAVALLRFGHIWPILVEARLLHETDRVQSSHITELVSLLIVAHGIEFVALGVKEVSQLGEGLVVLKLLSRLLVEPDGRLEAPVRPIAILVHLAQVVEALRLLLGNGIAVLRVLQQVIVGSLVLHQELGELVLLLLHLDVVQFRKALPKPVLSLLEPGLLFVLAHETNLQVQESQVIHAVDVAFLRTLMVQLERLIKVLFNSKPELMAVSQVVDGPGVAAGSSLLEPLRGLLKLFPLVE